MGETGRVSRAGSAAVGTGRRLVLGEPVSRRPDAMEALAGHAARAAEARRALRDAARALAAEHGVEVMDVREAGAEGEWEVRVRIARAAASVPPPPAGEDGPPPLAAGAARWAQPFRGDGTGDLLRFVREADPASRIPPPEPGRVPVAPLSSEERLRLLAGVSAGDALLATLPAGTGATTQAVAEALAHDGAWSGAPPGHGERVAEIGVRAVHDVAASELARRPLGEA